MNPQHGNVGNLGDILKHAALDALSSLMAVPQKVTLNYLDSHAYQLRSRLANPLWREQVGELAGRHPAYRRYEQLEGPLVGRGEYLCSAGIALTRLPHAHLVLCERDPGTRVLLADQVARERAAPVSILDDAAQCCTSPETVSAGRLLALLDPFVLTDADWRAGLAAVQRLHRPGEDGLLEVFAYARDAAVDWPRPPRGWTGPIARIDSSPYHLAVFASGRIGRRAVTALERLGWSR